MIGIVNRLGDRLVEALLPTTSAAAADCICCPGGHHSLMCDYQTNNLYRLSCCCQWQWVCGPCCW